MRVAIRFPFFRYAIASVSSIESFVCSKMFRLIKYVLILFILIVI